MDDAELFIKRAVYLAQRSPFKRFKSGAVITKRGVILAEGWSHIGPSLRELYSVHSEIHSLGRARHLDLSGSTAYVATISKKSGNITLAKPCITCAIAMASAGVELAYYTVNNDEWDYINLDDDIDTLDLYRASPSKGRQIIVA